MPDENGICGAGYVLEYWRGSARCNQNISMCSHGMLDRYRIVTTHFCTAVGLLRMEERHFTPKLRRSGIFRGAMSLVRALGCTSRCYVLSIEKSSAFHSRLITFCGEILSYLSGSADPLSMSSSKALDAIGKSLQSQYERWQPRVRMVFVLSL